MKTPAILARMLAVLVSSPVIGRTLDFTTCGASGTSGSCSLTALESLVNDSVGFSGYSAEVNETVMSSNSGGVGASAD